MKKVVVASDSFKGSLSSFQVADAVGKGVLSAYPGCKVVKLAVADGGEGTVDALSVCIGGRKVGVRVNDPLGRPVDAYYLVKDDLAVLEMSSASGLTLLSPDERNPSRTSTYGTGQLIADALSEGCRRFLVGLGGSATNDGGMGMLSALGFRFLDAEGNVLEGIGENLSAVYDIDSSQVSDEVKESRFTVVCDVDSPFCGPEGAAYVFASQKGADSQMICELDRGLAHLASVVEEKTGRSICSVEGAGAAGGLGGAFLAFLDADIRSGAEVILDMLDFNRIIADADLVITGEGRLDSQTLSGKLPYAVWKRASGKGLRVIAVCGVDGSVSRSIYDDVVVTKPEGMSLPEAMCAETASRNIAEAVETYLKRNSAD